MAYEVTATRKRPRDFEELSGQEFVATTLKSSLSQQRIAHAYLFSGPRGVGKTSAARILAKALNCETGPTAEPCGDCSNCREITGGNAMDVIEIDGASNTSVNDVREIKNEVLFAPNSSRYKIYIIDEVHMLSNSAFNALLKTIEEPPPYIVFIFATTEGHRVPATIRSRCQQFHFQLIAQEIIQGKIAEAAGEQDVSVEQQALFWIAKEAAGSLRDAYTLFDQIASFSQQEITLEKIQDKLGLVSADTITVLVEELSESRSDEALQTAEAVLSRGVSIEQFIIDMAEYFRSMLFIQQGITREAVLGNSLEQFPEAIIQRYSQEQLETALDMLLKLYRDIRYSINQRYELELLLSRLSKLHQRMTPGEIYHRLEQLSQGKAKPADSSAKPVRREPAAASPNREAPAENTGPLSEADIAHLVKALKESRPALASVLEQASWSAEGDALHFRTVNTYGTTIARQEIKQITAEISRIVGRHISVTAEGPEQQQAKLEPEESDDTASMVQHLFRGEIISGGSNESE